MVSWSAIGLLRGIGTYREDVSRDFGELRTPEVSARLSEELIKRVVRAADLNVSDPAIFSFHGTSIEAVAEASRTGMLPPGEDNYIYVAPRPSAMPFAVTKCNVPLDDEGAFEEAAAYATGKGGEFKLLRHFGMALTRENCDLIHLDDFERLPRSVERIGIDQRFAKLFELGVTPQMIIAGAELVARKDHGVVLTLSRSVLDDFRISEAMPRDDGLRIYCPNGIPLSYLGAVTPLGRDEAELFGI